MRKVLKIVVSDFVFESRDKREVEALVEAGYTVTVLARRISEKYPDLDLSYEIIRKPLIPSRGPRWTQLVGVICNSFHWMGVINQQSPNLISAHDWFPLTLAWLATNFKKNRPLLIYDSHELELGRAKIGRRTPIRTALIKGLERFLIKRSDAMVVVNSSISEIVKNAYRLDFSPDVVRNIPEFWDVTVEARERYRGLFRNKIGVSENSVIVMYHGIITVGRGVEMLISAVELLPENYVLVILGYGMLRERYQQIARDSIASRRIIFHDAVPFDELYQHICGADVGTCLIENYCESYYNSLPNKLFEYIQAGVPVLGSNFPEIEGIIESYSIGKTCDPTDCMAIVESILDLTDSLHDDPAMAQSINVARHELCWEKEKIRLLDTIRRLDSQFPERKLQ